MGLDRFGWTREDTARAVAAETSAFEAAAVQAEVNEGRYEYITHMLRSMTGHTHKLTEWELDFLTSVADQFGARGTLTDKQMAHLELIYAEHAE